MSKNIGILAGVIVIASIAFITLSDKPSDEVTLESTGSEDVTTMSDEASMETMDASEMMEEESGAPATADTTAEPAVMPMASGSFETYSAEKVATAAGDVVIFFHATWCPSCRALVSNIEENIATIPAGTTILKADYDTETELKKKYGVTTQHTLVQVDSNGNLIKKWSGGSKLENLLLEIQ